MVEPGSIAPFLAIPLETREQIYENVLTDPTQSTSLLQTCRNVHTEGHTFLFGRPLVFRGQQALYRWLEQVPEEHFRHVTNITLELRDVDLRPVLDANPPSIQEDASPRLQTWDLHEQEVERLHRAMNRLPNIRTLTVCASSDRQSYLYRNYVSRVLGSLHLVWPGLQSLALDGNFHHQDLSFIAALSELRSFTFDGFSANEPAETADILSRLTRLSSLSVVSHHGLLTPTHHYHSGFPSKLQSFTGNVLSAIPPLEFLYISEQCQHATVASPALFFTPEVLEALPKHPALKRLSIVMTQPPDSDTLDALGTFLEQSSLEHLELDMPGLDSKILEQYGLITNRLTQVWLRAASLCDASELLNLFCESKGAGDAKALRRVVLVREVWADEESMRGEEEKVRADDDRKDSGTGLGWDADGDGMGQDDWTNTNDEQMVRNRIDKLRDLGVKVLWRTETA